MRSKKVVKSGKKRVIVRKNGNFWTENRDIFLGIREKTITG